jgi:hypothetical protein
MAAHGSRTVELWNNDGYFGNLFVLCAMPPAVMHRLFAETILQRVLPVLLNLSCSINVHPCQAFCQLAPLWTVVRGHSLFNHKHAGHCIISMNKVGSRNTSWKIEIIVFQRHH